VEALKTENGMLYDLIVIGAGPAGSSAAISAARQGARVLLLERGRFPRHKVCGEFVSAESLGVLKDLLDLQYATLIRDAGRIRRARIFFDGRTLRAAVNPAAASIARFDLDAALWRSAESAGVDARQQVTVQSVAGGGPFRVKTASEEFEARALINATGRWSNLNRSSEENGGGQEKWLGVKAHFTEPISGRRREPSVDLYFFDGGYCGVQPVDVPDEGSATVRVNASAMVRADVATSLPEVFAQHPALRERSQNWTQLSDPISTSPLIFRDPQPEKDGILMAGDAAGFVDPFVGDGISLALRSGSLAAMCLTPFFAAQISLSDAVSRYSQAYRGSLLPVFRASSKIRRMMMLPEYIRRPILTFLERAPAITTYLVRKTR
jgi:menaquinone-9 beta-reductase